MVTGDSQEEVMIFRYKQTNRHFIIIYISSHNHQLTYSSKRESSVLPYEKVCPSVRSAQGSDFLGAETSPRIGTSGPRCLPDVDDNDDVDDDIYI